jgi:hypothetical protein
MCAASPHAFKMQFFYNSQIGSKQIYLIYAKLIPVSHQAGIFYLTVE